MKMRKAINDQIKDANINYRDLFRCQKKCFYKLMGPISSHKLFNPKLDFFY